MKYLDCFLSNFPDTYPDLPAKPAKPPDRPPEQEVKSDLPAEDFDAIPDRSVWRSCLARWPDDRRLQWGRRANDLEVTGLPWNEAEFLAFKEMLR